MNRQDQRVVLPGFRKAILGFADWDRPWLFRPGVEARLPDDASRVRFGTLWAEAVGAGPWRTAGLDLPAATLAVQRLLAARYPMLGEAATAAVARAAAYQWR